MIRYFFGAIIGFLISTIYFCNIIITTHDLYQKQIPKIAKTWYLTGCKMGIRVSNEEDFLFDYEKRWCELMAERDLKDYETIWAPR